MTTVLSGLTPCARVAAVVALCLTGACASGGGGTGAALPPVPEPSAAVGDVPADRLRAALLQPEDLPGLDDRRENASADLSTQATPQLSLCQDVPADAPHEIAGVIARSGRPGEADVFEVLSVYADEAGARAALARARAAAQACPSYDVPTGSGRTTFTLEDLGEPVVPGADEALHYRLTAPDVVSGDVRTVVRRGRSVVLLTGFGAPPGGQSLLDFQAGVAARAVTRLP